VRKWDDRQREMMSIERAMIRSKWYDCQRVGCYVERGMIGRSRGMISSDE